MRRDWLQTARNAIRRDQHRNALAGAVAGLGAAIAIGVMEWFSLASHYPLFIIPFATSIVLVIGSPEAEPAQPRALIGGHVVATLVGLAVLELTGPQAWAAAATVGLAVCWWSQIAFPGRFCSCRCWQARCCWPPWPMSGTDRPAAGRGHRAGCEARCAAGHARIVRAV